MRILKICLALLCGISVIFIGTGTVWASTIAGAECFIDHDPGEGSGMPMICSDGACDEEREASELVINLSSLNLKIGYHTVYCRVMNDSGHWSIARPIKNDLRIGNPNLTISGEQHIAAPECFFDTDPGPGLGFSCECADGVCDEPEEEIVCSKIDISGLSPGTHRLYCRMKDSNGLWGAIRSFVIQTYDPPYLVTSEYFVDEDPGVGNGTPLLPKDWFFDESEEEIDAHIDFSDYASGNHFMHVRMKDNYGRWGLPDCMPFGENPCEGDFDGEGDVDGLDLAMLASNFGRTNCCEIGEEPCQGDFDGDCDVDGSDLALFATDFGKMGCPVCP